jgi:DNA polymerase III subunit epsilon
VEPFPEPGTPWRQAPFAAVDFETTGLDPARDEIISFAVVGIDEGRIDLGRTVYRLVRPGRMPDSETIRIHGLFESDLENAPALAEAMEVLLAAIAGVVIVAHVAAVERGFLKSALAKSGLDLTNPIVDTAFLWAELARLRGMRPSAEGPIGLTMLAQRLGLPVHRPHHADGDALTTAQAFLALSTQLDTFSPQTVGSLVAARPPRPRRRGLVERLRGLGTRGRAQLG